MVREVSSLFLQGISEVILKQMYVNEFIEPLVSRTLPNLIKPLHKVMVSLMTQCASMFSVFGSSHQSTKQIMLWILLN